MTRISPKIVDVYTTSTVVQDLSRVTVTAVETTATFSTQRKSCLIYNRGPNDAHINFDATATVNNFAIPALDALQLVFPVTVLHFICAAGQTCDIDILGER